MPGPEPLPFPFFAPSDRLTHDEIAQADISSHPDYLALEKARLRSVEVRGAFQFDKPLDERNIPPLDKQNIAEHLYLSMKLHERWLADKAKARVNGAEDSIPEKSREEITKLLAEDYRVFGIAQGAHSAKQLIREYESAVEDKARKDIGGQTR